MKKRYIVILVLFVFYIIGTVGESEEITTNKEYSETPVKQEVIVDNNEDKKVESWSDLLKTPDRYKEVMIIVGERFAESASYYYDNYTDLTSEERQLVMELYHYKQDNDDLSEDFKAAFTEYSKNQDYDYFGIDFEKNEPVDENDPFYKAITKSFTLGHRGKDDTYHLSVKKENAKPTDDSRYDEYGYIPKDNPYIMTFNDTTHTVGKCTFALNEIKISNSVFKRGTYHNCYRVFLTVTNNSNTDTIFWVKDGTVGANYGTYYESTGEKIRIGSNNNGIGWPDDGNDPIFDNLDATHNIPANSTKKICVQLGHVTVDKLQYTDKPRLDLYFTNENEIFTLSINKPAE